MKKVLIVFMCFIIVFSLSSCKKHNTYYEPHTSSDIILDETIAVIESQPNTFTTDTESNNNSSTPANEDTSHTEVSSEPKENSSENTTQDNNGSYNDIVCNVISNFQQVGFSIKGTNKMVFIKLPQEWKLNKETNGYSILKNSQTIGNITTAKASSSSEFTNVFKNTITSNDINVTHSIDCIITNNNTSYTRTLCYNYTDEKGNNKNIYITIPYQEIDSSAVYKMITEVKADIAATDSNLGILRIEDDRKKILIMGNSFIGSSRIGTILQTMCGDELYVEAMATGYAHVGTYTKNPTVMQKIRDGNYSVVFMCGLYDQEAVNDLSDMIKVCQDSNTKLAVFPAHNESQPKIDHAISLYPDTLFLNWKSEIDNLINKGIDVSNFCIPDAHNHSTPLAGYVGAHMIYRAIFNKIPQVTQFTEISESQINLLGEYITTGSITLINNSSAYVIE